MMFSGRVRTPGGGRSWGGCLEEALCPLTFLSRTACVSPERHGRAPAELPASAGHAQCALQNGVPELSQPACLPLRPRVPESQGRFRPIRNYI